MISSPMTRRMETVRGARQLSVYRARARVAWRLIRQDLQRWPFDLIVNVILASPLVPRIPRCLILRALGMQLETYEIYPRCTFRSAKLRVGKDTVINSDCHFDNDASIEIGAGAGVAMGVRFVTSTHKVGGPRLRASELELKPIVVGDGAWIGAGAMILPGVTIGEGCIIGAAALVTSDCAPHGVYVGVPARRVSDLPT
jgi:maltose O-acetyltransferase